jgi:phosphatidylglycerophosphatase A
VLLALGIWASSEAERIYARKDDGRIVIDEVVGQLLCLAPLTIVPPPGGPRSPMLLGLGFLIFRLFDIWKPGPVRWAERSFPGGAGVMFDDVLAGILAAAVILAATLLLGGAPA